MGIDTACQRLEVTSSLSPNFLTSYACPLIERALPFYSITRHAIHPHHS